MKFLGFALLLLAFQVVTIAQDADTDPRLVNNIGESAVTLQKDNPDYYDFLVYELDNAFFITTETPDAAIKQEFIEITMVKDKEGNAFDAALLEDITTFNFKSYTFKQTYDNRVVYDLEDGRYLIFYTLKEVKENYKKK